MFTRKRSSDEAFLTELGKRIAHMRLNRNLTQAEASLEAGVSKRTLEHMEAGDSIQLISFLRILRAFHLLDSLQNIFPSPTASPMAQLQLQHKQRRRASRKKSTTSSRVKEEPWAWGSQS